MKTSPEDRPPLSVPVKIGAVLFAGCAIAALWLGEWRLAATGVLILLVLAIVTSGSSE